MRPRKPGRTSQGTAEVDDVAVADDVVLAFEQLESLGFDLLHGPEPSQGVVGCDLRADESLGQVGVDLAGGVDRSPTPFEVPAPNLGIAGGEEGDDADCVVGSADNAVAGQLFDP